MKTQKKYFFILNELNILFFLALIVFKKKVLLYRVRPYNRFIASTINIVVSYLYKKKLFLKIEEIEEIDLISDRWIYSNYPHHDSEKKYSEVSAFLLSLKKYNYWKSPYNDFSYSFKAINKQYIDTVVKDILWMEWLEINFNRPSYFVFGLYSDTKLSLKKQSIFFVIFRLQISFLHFNFVSS